MKKNHQFSALADLYKYFFSEGGSNALCDPNITPILRFFSLDRWHFTGPSQAGGWGALSPPQFLADQFTLSRPGGGHIIPTHYY